MVTRPPDWPERLDAFLASRATMPFAWGSHDCVTFAAAWLTALGQEMILPTWRTETEADALLDERGGLQLAVQDILGLPSDPAFLGRGDIALTWVGEDTPLGICTGSRVALAGPDRLIFVPRRLMRVGWRV